MKMKVYEYDNLADWHELCERGCWFLIPDDGRMELFRHYPMDILGWPEEFLTGYDWAAAVAAEPSLEKRCRFDKMTDAVWHRLVEERPKLASVPFDQRNVDAMSEASARRGKALNGRASRTGAEWVGMLKEDVNASFCCDWDKLSGDDWVNLPSARPMFAVHCDWSRLDGGNWADLLMVQPQFAPFCDWAKIPKGRWHALACRRPELAWHCPKNCRSGDKRLWKALFEWSGHPYDSTVPSHRGELYYADMAWGSRRDAVMLYAWLRENWKGDFSAVCGENGEFVEIVEGKGNDVFECAVNRFLVTESVCLFSFNAVLRDATRLDKVARKLAGLNCRETWGRYSMATDDAAFGYAVIVPLEVVRSNPDKWLGRMGEGLRRCLDEGVPEILKAARSRS